ncbi:hypothetical protein Tco_1385187 [Tanacetum coccineum]
MNGSSKRVGEELEQESIKKQKVDEDRETAELQSLIEVIPDEEVVTIDVVPLANKPPTIERIVGIKRLLDDLRVTVAQVYVTAAKLKGLFTQELHYVGANVMNRSIRDDYPVRETSYLRERNDYHVKFGMLQVNKARVVMSSVTSAVTYTSVYTDSEPDRAFWGADDEEISEGGIPRVIVLGYNGLPMQPVALPSPDYISGPEDPQTPPVPQDEDEREPMFVHAHDLDFVPEPIYPEYIPLEDEHEFLAEEQPLPLVDSPTAESPEYVTKSDPEEDPEEYEDDETEDGPVDYPIDGEDDGDDDDGDSSGDDADGEDEDDEEGIT